jgi:co-chaperonin GroES (HSP10)
MIVAKDHPLQDRIQVRQRALLESVYLPGLYTGGYIMLPGRLMVAMATPPERSKHGLVLPDDFRGRWRNDHGVVVATGVNIPLGSQVLVAPYDGLWFELDNGVQYRMYGCVKPWDASVLMRLDHRSVGDMVYTYDMDIRNGHPTGNNVLIESDDAPELDPSSGLYLPDVASQPSVVGKVISTGPHVRHVRKGMYVVFSPSSMYKLDSDGDIRYLIGPEDGIYAIVEGVDGEAD